jgi:HTH-type transcriptional regulator/antitoxin HigA
MILNDLQLATSQQSLESLIHSLDKLESYDSISADLNVLFLKAQQRAVGSKIHELRALIDRYKELRSGRVKSIRVDELGDLGRVLVEARICAGLSQRDLADRVGIKEQQIQRYEADCYRAAKLERIQAVLAALRSEPDITIRVPSSAEQGASPSEIYPFKEMQKRGWLRSVKGTAPMPFLAAQYVAQNIPASGPRALHRLKVRSAGNFSPESVLAWKARILELARNLEPELPSYQPEEPFDFRNLVELSAEPDGIKRAVSFVRSSGIALVFEKHLPKTHLDGAAMLAKDGRPVIGMTIRHDREDNFWFVLLHELAHVKLHHSQGLESGFFDDHTADSNSRHEREADEFALNALIPTEIWDRSPVRFAKTSESIEKFARRLKISPAIVAGRVRSERQVWKKFVDLVPSGSVRNQLVEINELED